MKVGLVAGRSIYNFYMSVILTIDQGNTAVKASVVDDGKIVDTVRMSSPSLEQTESLLGKWDVDGVVYCSVAGLDVRFAESLRMMLSQPLLVLGHSTPLPIDVDYASPRTLGLDRVAAAAGAVCIYGREPMLVADAGTALTLDVVDGRGAFLGGNISPGLALRFRALHSFTSRLPLVEAEGELPSFGYDTVTAIRSGAVRGIVAEINDTALRAAAEHGVRRTVITGGDAAFLMPLLDATRTEINIQPDLIAVGLYSIFKHNENL